MTDAPLTAHGSFTLKRNLAAPPARVFRAFADPEQKRRWFGDGEGFTTLEYALDFRDGGSEVWRGRFGDGPEIVYRSIIADIVPDRRIVTTYQMWIGGPRISVSLATFTLEPEVDGTLLVMTEHGVHLDERDSPEMRRKGTEDLLDALARSLAE